MQQIGALKADFKPFFVRRNINLVFTTRHSSESWNLSVLTAPEVGKVRFQLPLE